MHIRTVHPADRPAWQPLWDGYNAFYGREGETALDPAVTETTWNRFFDPQEPVFAWVAEADGRLLGLVHYLFHRSTTRIAPVCYLQDLFTAPDERGRGIGRALIGAVYEQARAAGCSRVYRPAAVRQARAARRLHRLQPRAVTPSTGDCR